MPLEGMTDYAALGLVDFAFVPHLNEKTDLAPLKAYSQQYQTTVYGCSDDTGIIVNGERIECIGNVLIIANEQVHQS
jgi:peptidase E